MSSWPIGRPTVFQQPFSMNASSEPVWNGQPSICHSDQLLVMDRFEYPQLWYGHQSRIEAEEEVNAIKTFTGQIITMHGRMHMWMQGCWHSGQEEIISMEIRLANRRICWLLSGIRRYGAETRAMNVEIS